MHNIVQLIVQALQHACGCLTLTGAGQAYLIITVSIALQQHEIISLNQPIDRR